MMEQAQSDSATGRRFAGIEIPAELKWSNFFNLYVASFCIAALVSIPAVLQPAFLKEVINIPREQAGSINSGLQNMSQVAWLLFVGIAGIFSDKVGRRILAIAGFLILGVFFIVFGYAKDVSLALGITSIGGQVFVTYVIRFIVGIGIILAFPQTITMVADYTSYRDRGKGMAYHGMMMSLGSILVFGVLVQVARTTGLMSLFYMSGVLGFLGVIVSQLGLVDRMPKQKAKKLGLREIYPVVSRSLAIKVSYLTTLVGRVDIVVISTFLIVWMVYAAEKFGVYAAEKFGVSPVKATARGGIALLVMSFVTMVVWPFIGILLDRWGRVQVMVTGLISAGVGFCLIGATENPFSPMIFVYVCLLGVGFSATQASANALASDASPKQMLGSILGGLNTMQPLGALFFLQAGGFIFDNLGYWSAFVLKGVADLICGLWIFAVRKGITVPKEEGMPGPPAH
jgi:MFS family permease